MKTEELKQGQTVYVKGIITDIEEDEILDLEIHTSENNFCVNSSDVYVSIDKPKPEVPKFVADWIEICDMRFVNLNYIFGENCPEKVKEWASVYGNHKKMLQALLYGYTIQKEKLYTVVIPNPNEGQLSFVLMRKPGGNISINVVHSSNLDLLKTDNDLQLTEKEIKKDFDWAWQWKKEVTE
ncbi:DUF1642 domain-containing protein [Streptococcus uberis]|uniref:DUF1642 domain-containing protein n=1 Tax=Streptococcus uberis TaxID=1349 RepID=UPI000DFC7692|nr:DUF1642 domain-containing protein [Streptococcus uberis]SUO90926.1 Protein of uncharacterised function (DUF1642) [Streptococcus uberis]